MKKNYFISSFLLFTLLFGSFFFANSEIATAQVPSNITDDIILEMTPQNPSPGQQVRVEVESFTTDLQKAIITWTINGEARQQEVGNQTFIFIAPNAGINTVVGVVTSFSNGSVARDSIIITPSNVDVIVEGLTYTPPMYNGRALFTHQSEVNIAAIPTLIENGRQLSANEIFYGWEINGTYIRDVSGVGRDNIIYRGRVISRPITIDVTAENISGTLKARKIIVLEPEEPEILLYEQNPLQGVLFEKALLGQFNIEREELAVAAVPYFFDVKKRDDIALDYKWGENGSPINSAALSSNLTFRNAGLQKNGISEIAVSTNHLSHLLQDASIGFTLNVIGNNQITTQNNNNDITVF